MHVLLFDAGSDQEGIHSIELGGRTVVLLFEDPDDAERYAGLLISIASMVVLARLLTPQQVGIYSMCAAFAAVAGILRDFGVRTRARDVARALAYAAFSGLP